MKWAKKEYPKESTSGIFSYALHDLRTRVEAEKPAAALTDTGAGTAGESIEEAFYQKTFGHIKRDYGSAKQMLNDLGSNRVYRVLHELLDPLQKENPPYANYCIERLKQEYPELYEIWE